MRIRSGTDAARGDVGHATILETDARVGDVFAPAQDRDADGIDRLHGRPNEMQNNFEIVNHEVEHDPDVGAAIWERRKPMRFDEARMGQARFQRAEHRIETLDMPDLQNEMAPRRELSQLTRLGRVIRDWLLDQQMLPFFQQADAQP